MENCRNQGDRREERLSSPKKENIKLYKWSHQKPSKVYLNTLPLSANLPDDELLFFLTLFLTKLRIEFPSPSRV
jgi:hypothetical protein